MQPCEHTLPPRTPGTPAPLRPHEAQIPAHSCLATKKWSCCDSGAISFASFSKAFVSLLSLLDFLLLPY